jgi:hypothetical protein
MLVQASLYNRQILASALLATHPNPDATTAQSKSLGLRWSVSRPLTHFDAELTPYDIPSRGFPSMADFSSGTLSVSYLAPLDDTQFDALVGVIKELSADKP